MLEHYMDFGMQGDELPKCKSGCSNCIKYAKSELAGRTSVNL